MIKKIKEMQKMCEKYNVNLRVQYYGDRQVCFIGMNEDEDEVFSVSVWYPPERERKIYFEFNSDKERWTGGHFSKEDILLLLSIDDLTDKELGIKPQSKLGEKE